MRVAICGRNTEPIRKLVADYSFGIDEENPDVVISYGGDGVLLGAERKYPGVPKCPVRDEATHPQCAQHGEAQVLDLLWRNQLKKTRLIKLEAMKSGVTPLRGLNDIMVNKHVLTSCVRYRLWLDEKPYAEQIVGDGLVAATPFGSTAYYRSITRSLFQIGIGVAFNNSTEPFDHLVIKDETEITVEIIRGPAALMADNDPRSIPLEQGNRAMIRKSGDEAVVLGLEVFRCPMCSNQRQNAFPVC